MLFFAACTPTKKFFTNQPIGTQKQNPRIDISTPPDFKLVYIKSPLFNYYDYALIRTNEKLEHTDIFVELFKLGKNIGNIAITKNQICFMNDCAPKWPASKSFFGKVAYANLFDDIIMGRDIFNGKGKMINSDGALVQRFQQSGQVIYYERKKDHILFQNLSNGVILSIDKYIDPAKQYFTEDED
ncbi:hypothetical protein [Helicobacter mustelae]|nr:hypothetical protein [Helicobacter mustelae]